MQYFTRRLKSVFFWTLCLWLVHWHSQQPEAIIKRLAVVQAEIDDARFGIANGYYDAVNICNDGWRSSSSGQGTCSWHGGINRAYQLSKSTAHSVAGRDIERIRARYHSEVRSKAFFMFTLAFLFAPLLDLIVLRRTSLYSYMESDAPSKPIQQSKPPPAPPPVPIAPQTTQDGILGCPRCGSAMRQRVAKKGRNRGNKFLGCSTYPRCHGTRDLPYLPKR